MISLYLLYFYTDVMDLNEVSIALMFVVCRVIDAGTDLLIGYCIDKTHTKWENHARIFFLEQRLLRFLQFWHFPCRIFRLQENLYMLM